MELLVGRREALLASDMAPGHHRQLCFLTVRRLWKQAGRRQLCRWERKMGPWEGRARAKGSLQGPAPCPLKGVLDETWGWPGASLALALVENSSMFIPMTCNYHLAFPCQQTPAAAAACMICAFFSLARRSHAWCHLRPALL